MFKNKQKAINKPVLTLLKSITIFFAKIRNFLKQKSKMKTHFAFLNIANKCIINLLLFQFFRFHSQVQNQTCCEGLNKSLIKQS